MDERRRSSISSSSRAQQQQQQQQQYEIVIEQHGNNNNNLLDTFFGPLDMATMHQPQNEPQIKVHRLQAGGDSDEEGIHECLALDDDPLAGVVDDTSEIKACCPTMAYLRLQGAQRGVKNKLTPFGRRMHVMNIKRSYRLNSLLSAMATWTAVERSRRLRNNFRLVDADRVEWQFDQCSICLASCRFVKRPPCCRDVAICQLCWQNYVRQRAAVNAVNVNLTGSYELRCFACNKFVPYSEALSCTSSDDMNLIRPPGKVTSPAIRCPVCLDAVASKPQVLDDKKALKKMWRKKGGNPFQCQRCQHSFCGTCGLAEHPNLTCLQLTKSDVGFEKWAHEKHRNRPEFPNCRRCPSCSIPLSHSGGCAHMVCVCGAEFCYSCGRRYGFEFVHQIHTSEQFRLLPVVSCSKLWRSQRKRLVVHCFVSIGLLLGVAPLAVALAPIAGPVGLAWYLASKYKTRRMP